jgi:phosphoribosyl 1,2-cyclic phosphate phosphodiesterase
MKLTFLGTSAADFSSRLKGECKDIFDKDARRASCMLIGENFLIDCGMYCVESLRIAKADISKITDIFVTHFHADHFDEKNIKTIALSGNRHVRIWCRRDAGFPAIPNTEIFHMDEATLYRVNEEISVEAVDANHERKSFPQHYIFEIGGKKFMYAIDGAWFLADSFKHLRNYNLSLLVIDATCGDYEGDFRMAEHNSIPMIRLMLPSLKTYGIINESTKVYLSHIAPRLHLPHDEIVKNVEEDNLFVAYDGLEITL